MPVRTQVLLGRLVGKEFTAAVTAMVMGRLTWDGTKRAVGRQGKGEDQAKANCCRTAGRTI